MTDWLWRCVLEYGEERIWNAFDPVTLDRGFRYAEQGRVLGVTPAGDGFYARVRGSGRQVYRTWVRPQALQSPRPVDVQCTCPVRRYCKHGVAALVIRLDELDVAGGGAASPELALWLDDLRRAAEQPATSAECVVYVAEFDPAHNLVVQACKTRRRKDGSYGQLTGYQGDGRSGARFLTPADERVLMLLPPTSRRIVRATVVPAVLRELVGTERAYLGSVDGPRLIAGAERDGAFGWRVDDTGAQRLCLRMADDAREVPVVAGTPPWYLDPDSGEVGPVRCGVPDTLAATLLRAPAVPSDNLGAVREPLQGLGVDVPLPQAPAEESISGEVPTPHLHLTTRDLLADYASPYDFVDEPVPVAGLAFDYRGIEVAASERAQTVTVYRDDVLWRVERALDDERSALARLAELGLSRLDLAGETVLVPDDDHDWMEIAVETVPRLRGEGWRVTIAEDFPYRLVQPDDWYADLEDGDGGAWFDLELGVEVEGERHSLLPLLVQLIQQAPEGMSQEHLDAVDPDASLLVDLGDGRLLPLPAARVLPMLRTLVELYDPALSGEETALRLPAVRAAALEALETPGTGLRWEGGEGARALAKRLTALGQVAPAEPPGGLAGTLREYQRQGVGWLQALGAQALGGVLADDMGLGKTVQVLAHLLLEKEAGRAAAPSLVVAPLSLLFNWEREAERFAPGLRVLRLHGPGRHEAFEQLGQWDLVLTTYALATRDVDALATQSFHLLVLDEAQAVKNPRAKAAQAVRRLTAHQRLCLTGTPLENHLGELWAQFDFLLPGLLGDRQAFNRLYRRPIEKQADSGRQQALQRRVAPFLLRRTKAAIARELPAKTEIRREAKLAGAQRDLYETVRVAMHERVRQEVARRGLERSQVVVLDALLKLRQVCCDPRLLKMESARRVNRSAKLDLLIELLRELHEEGRRVLLFSQFTSMLELIEAAVTEAGIDYVKLTGKTKKREERVARFQSGEVPLFLISLKAGGTGLNLTAADTVIHYDPWWNPAVMQQATDRAHRIGQTQPVFVYHLLTRDTVEEKIMAMQQRKAELGEWLLGGGEGRTAALEPADVEALFEPLG